MRDNPTEGEAMRSRRKFLGEFGATAATAAALGTSGLSSPTRAAAAPKKVRMGIVGGGFGGSFQWHLHPECKVAGVSDLRADRRRHLQETYQCDVAYNSLSELVKDPNIDAVAVFTGAPDHVNHVCEVLAHGKHVICAVPAAMNMEECDRLAEAVRKSGLTYMMAETSFFRQEVITARRMYEKGEFGDLFCCEAEYHHDGLQSLFWENGQPGGERTWRYGFPPMHYPTHSTSMLISVTGERLTEVTCVGWGDDDPILKDNAYKNPFWSATAFFKTDRNHACRIAVYWKVAAPGTERASWYGSKKSFFMTDPNGLGPMVAESGDKITPFKQPNYYETELPPPLRIPTGHGDSHAFLTHEFIDALLTGRRPAIDLYEALAYTVPGIGAHQSALRGGETLHVPVIKRPA